MAIVEEVDRPDRHFPGAIIHEFQHELVLERVGWHLQGVWCQRTRCSMRCHDLLGSLCLWLRTVGSLE